MDKNRQKWTKMDKNCNYSLLQTAYYSTTGSFQLGFQIVIEWLMAGSREGRRRARGCLLSRHFQRQFPL